MKFAICNETFHEAEWLQHRIFQFAAECGYDGVEIAPFTLNTDVTKISPFTRSELRRAAEAAGIEICGLHWILSKTEGLHLTTPDADVRRRTSVYLGELARLCRDLGGDVMIFGSPLQRNRPDSISLCQAYSNAQEVISEAIPVLEETGVTLAMEPLSAAETNFLFDIASTKRLVDMVGSPQVEMMIDCKAMWATEPQPIAEVIRIHEGSYCHFHANDPNLQGPGFGELDFVPIVKALQEVNFDRWVSVEVFDYSPGPERLAKESIDYMKTCLAQAE
ncbi:sugar phosphate isomerase/epimerase family protein [Aeoliella sp.]|uniref:sugar phosphate isomerase/epimerase family protein n=1 Tax=Aeoliella sp. TaxID=2795800 RepID=UPI003CCBB798